jgi:hypothetical protein
VEVDKALIEDVERKDMLLLEQEISNLENDFQSINSFYPWHSPNGFDSGKSKSIVNSLFTL